MGKKLFIASDIHGFFFLWRKALKEKGFDIKNPDHIIVVLGDLIDRGPYTINCLNFVNKLPDDRKILIRGNHEDLMEDMLNRGEYGYHDIHNGTFNSMLDIYQATGKKKTDPFNEVKQCEMWRKYVDSTIDYYEGDNFVFVHGWIPCRKVPSGYDFIADWRHGDWGKARWINGMEAWSNGIDLPDKTIYCGHYHTSYGNAILHNDGREFGDGANFGPFVDKGICAIDGCVAYSKKVNVEVIEL